MKETLVLEINSNFVKDSDTESLAKKGVLITPPLNKDYWLFRVKLDNDQAVLGFPKFTTIGIGFAKEEDWNTNLPFSVETDTIYNHIKHNKKPSKASKKEVMTAIEMIQEQAKIFLDKGVSK